MYASMCVDMNEYRRHTANLQKDLILKPPDLDLKFLIDYFLFTIITESCSFKLKLKL